MRRRTRILLAIFLGAPSVCAASCLLWLNYYSVDLPSTSQLQPFTKTGEFMTTDSSGRGVMARTLAPGAMPRLIAALPAAEGDASGRGVYVDILLDVVGKSERPRGFCYSFQIARMMFASTNKHLSRQVVAIRLAHFIERMYSQEQQQSIYLNRAYFGDGVNGVADASHHYFAKDVDQLSYAETALLVGLLHSPSYYSPRKHPDRALARRNEVLDNLYKLGAISSHDAAVEKSKPLGVTSQISKDE